MEPGDAQLLSIAHQSAAIMALAAQIDNIFQTATDAERSAEILKAIAEYDQNRNAQIVTLEANLKDALMWSAKPPMMQFEVAEP